MVPEGTTCVLLGISGSGKTVLMKHIMGLLKPDRGTVLVEGQEVARMDESALNEMRRSQGILFQANALFDSQTVFEKRRESRVLPTPVRVTRVVQSPLPKSLFQPVDQKPRRRPDRSLG